MLLLTIVHVPAFALYPLAVVQNILKLLFFKNTLWLTIVYSLRLCCDINHTQFLLQTPNLQIHILLLLLCFHFKENLHKVAKVICQLSTCKTNQGLHVYTEATSNYDV